MGSGGQVSQRHTAASQLNSFGKLFRADNLFSPPFTVAEYRHGLALSSVYVVQTFLNARHLRVVFLRSKICVCYIRYALNCLFNRIWYLYSCIVFKKGWLYFYRQSENICYAYENLNTVRSLGELGRLLSSSFLTEDRLICISLYEVYISYLPDVCQALILELSQILADTSTLNRIASALQLTLEGLCTFRKCQQAKPLTPLSFFPDELTIEAKEIESLLCTRKPASSTDSASEKSILLHSSSKRMVALVDCSFRISACAYSLAVCAAYKLALRKYRANFSLTLGILESCEPYIISNRTQANASVPMGNFQIFYPIAVNVCAETKLSQICRQLLAAFNFRYQPQEAFMKACGEHYSIIRQTAGLCFDLQVQYFECSDLVVDYYLSDTDGAYICGYHISYLDDLRICIECVQKYATGLHCKLFEVWDRIACAGIDIDVQAIAYMLEGIAIPL